MEQLRRPERQTAFRDIELLDFSAKPEYSEFLTMVGLDQIPVVALFTITNPVSLSNYFSVFAFLAEEMLYLFFSDCEKAFDSAHSLYLACFIQGAFWRN